VKAILASSRWRVIDRTPDTLLKAIELVKVTRVPFWDALIGASMLEHGIETIVTENDRDFKKIRGVTAINPFK
jgi:predicted nucleic acid-binding protein